MNVYVEEQLAWERVAEARAMAAREALVRALQPVSRPLRVVLGLALIRVGHWLAGRQPRRAGQPSRAAA